MAKLDAKFYWAVFLRRLPHFLVVATILAAIGVTVAAILPPVYVSQARLLVEPQQIADELAASTVPIDPYEQIQIIEQRVMTRANLLALAERSGMFADEPDLTTEDIVQGMVGLITFTGAEPEEVGRYGPTPGAVVIGVAVEGPTAPLAARTARDLVELILEENRAIRSGRATDTLTFFEAEVKKLAEALERKAREIGAFKTAHVESLPDSLEARRQQQVIEQERLLALQREEAALRNERSTAIWVFERTGRSSLVELTPEEEQLELLRSERLQKLAIYAPTSSAIRVLEQQIASLERLVEEQRQARAMPGTDAGPASELDLELAPIDARLDFIAEEKRGIEGALAALQGSIAATPGNEMVLAGLERELETLRLQHAAASERLAQATVGERIELSAKGERFSLIEPPVEALKPDRPNRRLIAAAGMFGGGAAGLGVIVLLEMLNRSIRRPGELAGVGIAPLATIPYIRTRRELAWKRAAIAGLLALILVVVPAGLLLVHTYYMPLDLLLDRIGGETPVAAP